MIITSTEHDEVLELIETKRARISEVTVEIYRVHDKDKGPRQFIGYIRRKTDLDNL